MLYWSISLSWVIIGTLIFWCILSSKWAKLDPLFIRMLDTLRVFNPIPGHPGYLDLKFTLLRHAVAFLLSAVVIFFVKFEWILWVVLFLNVLYSYSSISRYRFRKQYIEESSKKPGKEAVTDFLAIPVKDSFCAVIFSVICSVLLFALYAIRP